MDQRRSKTVAIFGIKKQERQQSNSPKHHYSPRYIEFLHARPSNDDHSPRDVTIDYAKAIKVPGENKSISLQQKKEQLKNSIRLGFRSFQSPMALKEGAKNLKRKTGLLASSKKQVVVNTSSQLYTIEESVDRINNPQVPFSFMPTQPAAAEAPQEIRYDSPIHLMEHAKIQGVQSPQPCVSPSSLINNLYHNEQEGYSAPVFDAMRDFSSASKSQLSGADKNFGKTLKPGEQAKPTHAPFGMFNWDWESSQPSDAGGTTPAAAAEEPTQAAPAHEEKPPLEEKAPEKQQQEQE